MRRERVIQAGTCHHLVARVAKGESKELCRYDRENLLWQSTVAVKSDPVGSGYNLDGLPSRQIWQAINLWTTRKFPRWSSHLLLAELENELE